MGHLASNVHRSVLDLISVLMTDDPDVNTDEGRLLQLLTKAIQEYEFYKGYFKDCTTHAPEPDGSNPARTKEVKQ